MAAPIATGITRQELNLLWLGGYYDFPLSGLCRHGGSLCRFECENQEEAYGDHDIPVKYAIYALTPREKLHWLWRKKKFEICVGYHCTYPYRAQGHHFYRRSPKWLFALLWWAYWGKPYRGSFRMFWK
jgi:hypothetical protein